MTRLFYKLVPLAVLTAVGCFFLLSGTSSAATITVASGTDGYNIDSDCTLSEAITSINDGNNTTYAECTNTGDAFGSGDTINLPIGTITLGASLPELEESVSIHGEGMGQSIIDGAGQWQALRTFTTPTKSISIDRLTVTAYSTYAIVLHNTNVTIDQVEVDGAGAVFSTGLNSSGYGIVVSNQTPGQITSSISNVHVHDITTNNTDTTFGILVTTGDSSMADSGNIVSSINNVTIESITGSGSVFGISTGAGMYSFGLGSGSMASTVSNATITGIHSTNGTAGGFVAPVIAAMEHSSTVLLQNTTIHDVSGSLVSPLVNAASSGIIAFAGGFTNDLHQNINVVVRNTVVANTGAGCVTSDVSQLFGTNSTSSITVSSQGGNLSDDSSCATYFTQPTDQNNVAGLAATLSALADNGGSVPTMALKQGSPAIDSGITISGLTTDARGQARPQGSAYDSGAYESPYTKPAPTLAASGQRINLLLVASSLVAAALSVWFAVRKRQYVFARTR